MSTLLKFAALGIVCTLAYLLGVYFSNISTRLYYYLLAGWMRLSVQQKGEVIVIIIGTIVMILAILEI